jgi:hypothetical protein
MSPDSPFKVSKLKTRMSLRHFIQIQPNVLNKERLIKLDFQKKKDLSPTLLGSCNKKCSKRNSVFHNKNTQSMSSISNLKVIN